MKEHAIVNSSIVLFHNYISPSDEQPEQRILAYKQNSQLPVL